MSQLSPISQLLHKASKQIFGKYRSRSRISMPRLLDVWEEIITPDDATSILPSHIAWRRLEEGKSAGTLYVFAPSAVAAKLMYRESIIIERVNRYFGLPPHGCITRMSITHSRAAPSAKTFTKPKPIAEIDAETASYIAQVEDPVLREKLVSLARAMQSKSLL